MLLATNSSSDTDVDSERPAELYTSKFNSPVGLGVRPQEFLIVMSFLDYYVAPWPE